jgi:hypothetical protein
MNFNFFNVDKHKLEFAPDESVNIKELYYFDSNDMLQFNSKFDKTFK